MFFESNGIGIYVPMNDKKDKSWFYINDDLFNGTFKRMHMRDYQATRELSNVFVEKELLRINVIKMSSCL